MSDTQKQPGAIGQNPDQEKFNHSLDERLKKLVEEVVNRGLAPEEARKLAGARESFAKAIKAAVFASESKKELSPEQVAWLGELKTRFDALPQLHKGVEWADVEKSLRADPESMARLQALDEKGHKMNVFGEKNGEFIFVSAWDNYEQVAPDHRNIAYDTEGQKLAEKNGYKPNGNAVSIIARIMSVKEDEAVNYLADPGFHEQLRKAIAVNGWAWLKTNAAIRKAGAFTGDRDGLGSINTGNPDAYGSFRAELWVKKA